jgi:hypothetical protein
MLSSIFWLLGGGFRSPDVFTRAAPRYFIVEDLEQLAQQPDLRRFLIEPFPLVVRTDA